jgi:hypothetical protein
MRKAKSKSERQTFAESFRATLVNISFCNVALSPTAATTSIGGRIQLPNGAGAARTQITPEDLATGETMLAVTSPFGYTGSTEYLSVTATC